MSMVQPRVSDWGQFVDILWREHELMIMMMSMVQPRVSDWGQFVDILWREHELMIMMMSALYYEPQHA